MLTCPSPLLPTAPPGTPAAVHATPRCRGARGPAGPTPWPLCPAHSELSKPLVFHSQGSSRPTLCPFRPRISDHTQKRIILRFCRSETQSRFTGRRSRCPQGSSFWRLHFLPWVGVGGVLPPSSKPDLASPTPAPAVLSLWRCLCSLVRASLL